MHSLSYTLFSISVLFCRFLSPSTTASWTWCSFSSPSSGKCPWWPAQRLFGCLHHNLSSWSYSRWQHPQAKQLTPSSGGSSLNLLTISKQQFGANFWDDLCILHDFSSILLKWYSCIVARSYEWFCAAGKNIIFALWSLFSWEQRAVWCLAATVHHLYGQCNLHVSCGPQVGVGAWFAHIRVSQVEHVCEFWFFVVITCFLVPSSQSNNYSATVWRKDRGW